jgi:hypothetical protein
MPLDTGSIGTGVPTGDPLVWPGKVAETFSAEVYAKAFDSYLLSRVTRVSAASAYWLRRITTVEVGATANEGATTSETDMKGETQRIALATYRAQQKVSAELLADSDALKVVSNLLALELAEDVSAACADAVESASYDPTASSGTGAYRDNVITGGISTGVATHQTLLALAYGSSVPLNGFAAGNRFTQDQRSRIVMLTSGDTITEFLRTSVTGNLGGVIDAESGMPIIAGIPICTTVGMLANAASSKGGLHVACVDPTAIILAEQPMVISVDTESLAENNQVLITASYRAAAFLTSRAHATGLTLRTMSSLT